MACVHHHRIACGLPINKHHRFRMASERASAPSSSTHAKLLVLLLLLLLRLLPMPRGCVLAAVQQPTRRRRINALRLDHGHGEYTLTQTRITQHATRICDIGDRFVETFCSASLACSLSRHHRHGPCRAMPCHAIIHFIRGRIGAAGMCNDRACTHARAHASMDDPSVPLQQCSAQPYRLRPCLWTREELISIPHSTRDSRKPLVVNTARCTLRMALGSSS